MKLTSILSKEEIAKLQARHAAEIETILVRYGFDVDDITNLRAQIAQLIEVASAHNAKIKTWADDAKKKASDADARAKKSKEEAKAKREQKKHEIEVALDYIKKQNAQMATASPKNTTLSKSDTEQQSVTLNKNPKP